jgi:hypothetical protein
MTFLHFIWAWRASGRPNAVGGKGFGCITDLHRYHRGIYRWNKGAFRVTGAFMVINSPQSPATHSVEAQPSPQAQMAVRRLAKSADRLRLIGRQDEADAALLQAWAALDK